MNTGTDNQPEVAGILLAAGGSTRMGVTKQLLPFAGQPLVRHVAEVVSRAGLAQVVVVLGAEAPLVERVLRGLPLEIVVNEGWAEGLSTSVRAGLGALRGEIRAAIIVLADQPGLTAELLGALVTRYRKTNAPIVAPFHRGRRGNPVLFDRSLFTELLSVRGDQGGRPVLAQHHDKVERIELCDPGFMLDIDTVQDYERALEARAVRC